MLHESLRRATHAVAQFDGLTLEVADPARALRFWQSTLGGRIDDKQLRVLPGPGRPPREILRMHPTDTPAADDARVHVDVRLPGATPDSLVAAGARIVRSPGEDPWYVLADPEDNEFCAYPAVDNRPAGIFELVVKCADPHTLARWWADVLEGQVTDEEESAVVIGAPEFPWDYMVFDPVPGIEQYGSRMRWHLLARDRDLSALVSLGATVLAKPDHTRPDWLLADPAGNQFSVTCEHPSSDC